MEPATGLKLDFNHKLTMKEFPYIVRWREDRCKRCGQCTAVCPNGAIKPTVKYMRVIESGGDTPKPKPVRRIIHVIEQVNNMENYCTGCAMCSLVCPNNAIEPEYNPQNKFLFYKNRDGEGYKRGGRRNDSGVSTLDRLKFNRISMLTDPALDAGRHEFRVRSHIGRILPQEELPLKVENGRLVLDKSSGKFIPPVREIYPIMIESISIGALSPYMWEGLAMDVAYLNEVEGLPVVMCSGEGGFPQRLLKSRYVKYFILQIASGYFGWDSMIHTLPYMI